MDKDTEAEAEKSIISNKALGGYSYKTCKTKRSRKNAFFHKRARSFIHRNAHTRSNIRKNVLTRKRGTRFTQA